MMPRYIGSASLDADYFGRPIEAGRMPMISAAFADGYCLPRRCLRAYAVTPRRLTSARIVFTRLLAAGAASICGVRVSSLASPIDAGTMRPRDVSRYNLKLCRLARRSAAAGIFAPMPRAVRGPAENNARAPMMALYAATRLPLIPLASQFRDCRVTRTIAITTPGGAKR